jgi:hypothetical protein
MDILNSDGTVESAALAMPDIDALERAQGNEMPPQDAPRSTPERGDDGKFRAKPEAEAKPDADKAEPEAEKAPEAEADDDDPIVEYAEEEGKEPTRLKLSELWSNAKAADALRSELEEARTNSRPLMPQEVERVVAELAAERGRVVEYLQAQQAAIMPATPDISMTNPASPNYDPERFWTQLQTYQTAKAQQEEISKRIEAEKSRMSQEQKAILSARLQREQAELAKAWPELAKESVQKQVRADLTKHYGLDDDTINSVIDHRFYKLAKDALAYRAAKATEAAAVKKVSAKPKLITGAARSTQSAKQRGAAEARTRLAQSGSLEDAAAALDGLF